MNSKLVRDMIPEIIIKTNKKPFTHLADDDEYWNSLKEKLKEEHNKFLTSENKEELADMLEVIYAICDWKKWNFKDIEELRKKKAKERGGFKKKIILEKIE